MILLNYYYNFKLRGKLMSVFIKIWNFASKHKFICFLGILFTIFNVISSMVPGYITRLIIDDVITNGDIDLLPVLLLFLMLGALFRSASIFFERYFTESFSQNVIMDLKQALYDHMQKLSFNFFNKNKT